MTKSVSFARNSTIHLAGRFIGTALGVLAIALTTRYLGQAGFGHYSTIVAYLQLVGIITDLGLYLTLLRELGESPEAEHTGRFGSGLALRAATGAVAFALAPLVALALPYPTEVKAGIALMAVGFWCAQVTSLLTVVFQQKLRMAWAVAAELAGRAVFVGGTLVAIRMDGGLVGTLVANVANSAVLLAVAWWGARRLLAFRLHVDWPHWKTVLAVAWPIGLGSALNLIYFKADTLILSLYRSAEEVGLYGAPYRVLEIITTVPHLLLSLALPIMAGYWASRDTESVRRVAQRLFDLCWVIVWPLVAGCLVAATPVMRLVAGPEFASAGPILAVLSVAAGAIFFGTLLSYLVLVTDQQRRMLWVFGGVAAVSVVAYLTLIPRFSYWGAAWSTVGAELLVVAGAALVVRRRLALRLSWGVSARAALAAAAMALILWRSGLTNAVALVSLGLASYAVLAVALRAVPHQLLRDALSLKRNGQPSQ